MRLKKIYILPAVVAILTLTGCEKTDTEPNYAKSAPIFSASIDGVLTRAADISWDDDDKVGITGSGGTNVCHVCKVDDETGETILTVVNPDEQIYYHNANDIEEKFTAYYPWQNFAGKTIINANTTDQSKQKDFDFLWAEGKGSKAEPNVTLQFSHKMSKVTFTFINGKGMDVSTITSYKLSGFRMSGSFSLNTGNCAATTNAAVATVEKNLANSKVEDGIPAAPLILFPQTQKVKGPVLFEIYDSNKQYFKCNISFPEDKIDAGTNYMFTITVNKTGLIVNSATIENWKDYEWDEGEGQGQASSSDYPED